MDRQAFVIGLASTVAAPLAAEGQQAAQTPRRLGWLALDSEAASTTAQRTLRGALRELGWTEPQIIFESVFADGKAERLPSLVAELLSRRVEIIVTSGTTAIQAAKNGTTTVPVVMMGGGDPVGTGLVQSLARPGGNVTGVSLLGQELAEKNLELIKQAVPHLRTAVLIRAAANPANRFFAEHFEAAGQKLNVRVSALDIREPAELPKAINSVTADAAFMLLDPMFYPHRAQIAELAIQKHLPLVSADSSYAEAGFLFSHGFKFADVVRAAAPFIDKILPGARAGELPIEQPRKLYFVINLKTARALGLTIPPSLLARADQVIDP